MNNNEPNKKKEKSAVDHQLGMLMLLAVCAVIWKKETAIRVWLYENTLLLTIGGIAIFALIGLYLWSRFKKKEEEYFERRRLLRQVEPVQKQTNYYKRRGD